MKYVTQDTETGTVIDTFATEIEALEAIEAYESEDKAEGTYTDGFYEVSETE